MTEREERQERGSGREIAMVVSVLVLGAVASFATYWVQSRGAEARDAVAAATVEVNQPAGAAVPTLEVEQPARAAAPAPVPPDSTHADVYFDVKSVRLRADAVRTLQETAAGLDRSSTWGVLVQGYTDQQGSAEYNRGLALRRAEAVKRFLVELGVPESSVKVAAIGPDGALCDEATPECQQLNRRVHLEVRRLRTSAAPAVRPVVATDDTQTR